MKSHHESPISVKFPLRGEWCAVNTPGERIPSHGTDLFGQTYAYDFIQIDWRKKKAFKFFDYSIFKGLLFGVPLNETYCWSQPIFAPFDCEVIEMSDGWVERNPVHIVRDLFTAIKNGACLKSTNNKDLVPVLGNYVILRGAHAFSLIAHAKHQSIIVSEGETLKEGQHIADVGHSGNSTMPHLHFQLMDRRDLANAKGLACCFNNLEIYNEDKWNAVSDYIPGRRERFRTQ